MTEHEQLVERIERIIVNAYGMSANEAARAAIAECYRALMEPSYNMKVRGALVWEPDEYKRTDDYECGIAGETFVAMLAASPLNPEGGR